MEKGNAYRICSHTNTTGSHISSHHDRALACLELAQDPISFSLLFITVDRWWETVS